MQRAYFIFFWKGVLLLGEKSLCLRNFCTTGRVILTMCLLLGWLPPSALTSPHVPPQPKARQKDAAVKKARKVSAVFGPGGTLLTYRLISNGSPDLT